MHLPQHIANVNVSSGTPSRSPVLLFALLTEWAHSFLVIPSTLDCTKYPTLDQLSSTGPMLGSSILHSLYFCYSSSVLKKKVSYFIFLESAIQTSFSVVNGIHSKMFFLRFSVDSTRYENGKVLKKEKRCLLRQMRRMLG